MKNVMVLSGTASAINYINSLVGDPDINLHITDSDPYCPGLYAPGITPHVIPRARDTERYRAALDRLLAEQSIDVLIPTSDYDVEGVLHYVRDSWDPKVMMFRPSYEAFHLLGHKLRLMAWLTDRMPGVVPKTLASTETIGDLAFPVVVKPTGESGGKGVTIVSDRDDLAPVAAHVREAYGDQFVVQEFIPGRTYIVSMVYDHDGQLVISAGMRSHLTFFTWGGGGCAGEMVNEPELLRLCADVVATCGGWRGPINLEWRRHAESGAFYLLEANCRLNGYSYLTTMNGVCLPRVVLALLMGTRLPLIAPPAQRRVNFVLGFRETLVDRWVSSSDRE